ncbi:unnamed protein product [Parajaminaea phylloscopi]
MACNRVASTSSRTLAPVVQSNTLLVGPSRLPWAVAPSASLESTRRITTEATSSETPVTPTPGAESGSSPAPQHITSVQAALNARAAAQSSRHRRHVTLSHLSELGSTQTRSTAWHPSRTRTAPPTAREVTVSHLIAATAHVGHSLGRVARAWQPWIYGTRHGIAQIDVEHATLPALRRASKVVRDTVLNDGVVLIVGTDPNVAPAVVAATRRMGPHGFHVARERWMPGVLSNAGRLLARAVLSSMQDYEDRLAEAGLEADVSSVTLANLHLKPDIVIVLSPKDNVHAIREATDLNIPTIAIVDTDVDPRIVTYPIPANDESLRVQELVVGVLSKAGQEGYAARKQNLEQWERKQAEEERKQRRARQMADATS